MENEKEQILKITVRYDDAIRGIAQYSKELDRLKRNEDVLKKLVKEKTISQDQYNLKMAESKRDAVKYQDAVQILTKHIRNQVKIEQQQEGSLKQLRAQLSNVTDEYDSLSEAERKAAKGTELKDKINAITNELKGAEEETQRFYRNVGNYENTIRNTLGVNNSFTNSLLDIAQNSKGTNGFFKELDASAKAFGKTLLSFMTNPAFLAIIGLVGVGTAFKFWYDYNKGLVEATKLTDQFTDKSGDDLKNYRNEVLALADVYDKDFKEVLISANALAKQFGITQDEALNLIKDGFAAGADSNGEFLDTLKEYPAYFKEAGISASEFVAITTQASDSGVFSDKAVDSIKEANLKIREMTNSTADALDGIGISSKKVQEDLSSGAKTTFDIMQEVSQKLSEFPANSSKVGTAIADIFGGPGEDAGLQYLITLKDIDTSLDNVKSKVGVLGKLQEEQLNSQIELENTLSSLFDITGGNFEAMTTEAKIFVNGALVSIINGVRDIIDWCKDLYDNSMLVRGAVSFIRLTFQSLYDFLKFFFGYGIANFKTLGAIIKAAFTLDFEALEQGVKQWKETTEKLTSEFAQSMKENLSGAIDDVVNKKIPPVKLTVETEVKTKSDTSAEQSSTSIDTAKQAEEKRKAAIKAAKEQRDKERDAIRQAEDALLSLVKDEREKRRKEINLSYSREIADLKRKLTEEKNLTAKAKNAIQQIIKAKEQQLQVELQKLSDEQLQKDIANRQKLIDTQLAAVKSGSEQEYQLKMQQLMAQRDMELSNTELTEQMKQAIRDKYNKQMDDLSAKRENDTLKKQADILNKRFASELGILESQNEVKLQRMQNEGASDSQLKQAQYAFELQELQTSLTQQNEVLANMKQLEGETNEAFNQRKVEQEQKVAETEVQIDTTKVESQKALYDDFRGAIDALGEHNKAFAQMSKMLALGEIAVNTGKAIAAGVAQAQSVPFPGNIAAIVTTIATVMANIATATKTVKSAKFASGGQVVGPGTGTSDSVPASLSNGESVITARATSMFSPILSSFNMMGGGVPINLTASSNQTMGEDMLARAVAKGVQMMPRPVVSVEEISSVSNRVEVLENLGNL